MGVAGSDLFKVTRIYDFLEAIVSWFETARGASFRPLQRRGEV